MRENRLKRQLEAGETVIGTFCILPSATAMEALGLAGLDFLILDTEHGPLTIETCEDLVRGAECGGATPIVRVADNRPELILRALDIGAGGVQVPQVGSREEALRAVRGAKYAPIGERGVSIFTRAGGYVGTPDHPQRCNAEQLVIVHIEGVRAVENLDEILSVDGIDVIFLGPYDLSQSLGITGQVDHPRVRETLVTCTERARAAGKFVGSYAKDAEMARWLASIGVQYIATLVDAAAIALFYQGLVATIRRGG
ncbi:MAG: 2,4-dihydroxyhept-2-ene-1,7-dioic acid aldolase [Candidatus Poribacteria bacterium]|nr:MAG: 2,4-dihydroxyhept-2-ene-1,7-dioic acid aldolase [Candidatus Poribacteria bacterium]